MDKNTKPLTASFSGNAQNIENIAQLE